MHRMYHDEVNLYYQQTGAESGDSSPQEGATLTGYKRTNVKCPFMGECFARTQWKECKILTHTFFEDHKCHFQKRYADITKGKRYQYDGDYDIDHRRPRNGKNNTK